VILPGAFPPLEKQDVRALWNHDPKQLLARSKFGKGTLKLTIDGVGLKYEFEAPQSTIGNDLLESIKRGDLDESSFSFSVSKGGDEWSEENGVKIRRIKRIAALYDISPVTEGAYADTVVGVRGKTAAPGAHVSTLAARRRLLLRSNF
jgi:HK97 family phage prohead protease